jgi:hypothetical protein
MGVALLLPTDQTSIGDVSDAASNAVHAVKAVKAFVPVKLHALHTTAALAVWAALAGAKSIPAPNARTKPTARQLIR